MSLVLLGSIVNALGIIVGTFLGLLLRRIPEQMKQTVLIAIGLSVVVLGIDMALKSANFFYVIVSLVVGTVIGEWIRIEDKLHQMGSMLERKLGKSQNSDIAQGFVTATLIFVVGAMAIVGALDSGLRLDHSVLLTKSMIDGFTSMVLASTLGVGVLFSAIPVFLYQGSIALFANVIHAFLPAALLELLIAELTATGGVLIFAIGINILGIKQIRVANLLPSIIIITAIVVVQYFN
ncbi:putative membrane protein YqgA involved in biofilm formation [Metabacillus crassostreae]|nr:putative membrane protein YqgA involved in biofilm formation [Metabacillus crassostreae]